MLQKIKNFCNKKGFDYLNGEVNAFEFHNTFYFYMKAFGIVKDKSLKKYVTIMFIILLIFASTHMTLVIIATVHGVQTFNLALVTEAGTYIMLMIYHFIILGSTKFNLVHYLHLLDHLKEDFRYICNEGSRYRERYFKIQVESFQICLACQFVTAVAVVWMCTFAILNSSWYLITYKPGVRRTKFHLHPYWIFDYDLEVEPAYSLVQTFSVIATLFFGYVYVFMLQTHILWVRQLAAKIDLVVWNLEDLVDDLKQPTNDLERKQFDSVIQDRMKKILIIHQSMYSLFIHYCKVFRKMLLLEQKIFSPITCMTAYCFVQKLNGGEFDAALLQVCVTVIFEAFIPSYLVTFLATKIRSVCDACFAVKFLETGPIIRPYLVLMMQRSVRPLPLKAAGFEEVSLKTYSSNLASAYSMFNMLRQINF
uniref:Odorant receptor n=1 Tax=Eogystia hippophaecolus TaxID=1206364 RepID=A0A1B3P5Q0_EOGHI|nr:odorant receptor [Eogystia hippophaecolus]